VYTRLGDIAYMRYSLCIYFFFRTIYTSVAVYIHMFCVYFSASGDPTVYVSIRIYYECIPARAPYICIDGFRFDCARPFTGRTGPWKLRRAYYYYYYYRGSGGGFRVYVSNLANDRLPYIIFNSANVADKRPLSPAPAIVVYHPQMCRNIEGTQCIIYINNKYDYRVTPGSRQRFLFYSRSAAAVRLLY